MMMKEEQLREGRISKYVFTKQGTCDPINPQSPTAYMDDFAKKYGIEAKCNPHKFRHNWITLALDNGVPVASVSEAVGHSDISITMGYAHLGEKASKQTSDIVLQAIANV